MPVLATIGYEGASLDDFIATLHAASIRLLIDVRALPISRRPGFAKNALSTALADAGVDYLHLKELGDPKEGRNAARANDLATFLRIFTKHLNTASARNVLAEAASLSMSGGACLMCYERDPSVCHRRLVAERIAAIVEVRIQHLGVKHGFAGAQRKADGTSSRTRQGFAARRQEAR
ncbi:MAG: DUF488 domain-containing protein [Alphaproteobacteria bacterium]